MNFLRLMMTVIGVFFALPAAAAVLIEIDKSAQRMSVYKDGEQIYAWPVSTGARGYDTPGGEFTPISMSRQHFSREWDDAPMPHSIFFTKRGHAIHGTEYLRNIGRPASHGCVRLEPENARALFDMVKAEGMTNVRVVLTGETAPGGLKLARRAPRRYYHLSPIDAFYRGVYRPPSPFFSRRTYAW